jgi:pyruvate formate lyase activating enzyme
MSSIDPALKQKNTGEYRLQETRLQEKLADGTTRCHLCAWRCRLRHGQRGFCQAHVNRNGTLYNLSYGIVSAIDISPIEEKPVKHFQPGTRVMSIGSYGCSFRCGGCHNLDISWGVSALDGLARGESTEAYVSPERMVETALKHQVQGIAFTYSEPAVWLEYVIDVSRLAHEAGLYTVYVSNSFVTDEALEEMAPYVDVLCSKVEDILNSIKKAQQLGMHVETRTNIIPTKNDDMGMLRRIACWIRENLGVDSPWHITKFFPAYQLSNLPPTESKILKRVYEIAKEEGLRNAYMYDDKGCDCADENLTVSHYLAGDTQSIHQVKKCSASCCGDEGVLLKKYEQLEN